MKQTYVQENTFEDNWHWVVDPNSDQFGLLKQSTTKKTNNKSWRIQSKVFISSTRLKGKKN